MQSESSLSLTTAQEMKVQTFHVEEVTTLTSIVVKWLSFPYTSVLIKQWQKGKLELEGIRLMVLGDIFT